MDSKERKCFKEIKSKLVKRPVLKLYNSKAFRTEVHTDSSAIGLGAILLQADKENEPLRLVYAVSRRTSETEGKYHSSRLELMAVAWVLRRLRPFLIGIHFTVITDCQCLVNIKAWKRQNSQIARWLSEISEYDFEIRHRKGENMRHVDALSRSPVEEAELNEAKAGPKKAVVMSIDTREDEVLIFQRSDTDLKTIIEILKRNIIDRTKIETESVKDYVLRDGLLFRKVLTGNEERELYVVPKAMRKSIVIRYHDLASHFGIDKTTHLIGQFYFFPKMRRYVRMHIQNCIECILSKRKFGRREGELHPIPPGRRPFEIVHADHLGPFITTPRQNKYILGIIDNLTKYVSIVPVKNVSARITVNKI